jgi:choline dehydrogenase-like flavoprotein
MVARDIRMNIVAPEAVNGDAFDIVIVGSGFGAAFFLHEVLRGAGQQRILVIEWGQHGDHAWQWAHQRNTLVDVRSTYGSNSDKPWNYTIGFGGGTNCWFAQTPRMHPADFRLNTLYGNGRDWPFGYDELEPFYAEAEAIMAVSGDEDMAAVLPRSGPFPQPPHRMSAPDRAMKAARPGSHFAMPTARAREATDNRAACCASLRCWLCPADAKFTVNNAMMHLFEDARVSVVLGAEVRSLDAAGTSVAAVRFRAGGADYRVAGDLFVLGANAIQSPAILLRSDLGGGVTGLGLHESYGASFEAMLDGMDNFDGSTITTGLDYGLYDGDHRREVGAAMVYFENRWTHGMRAEPGRLRQVLPLVVVTEDLPDDRNRVRLDDAGDAFVEFAGASDYAVRGMARARDMLPDLLAPLPVERIEDRGVRGTESHLQGTLRMGSDAAASVVDQGLLHHRLRNLAVVGTATFPSCSCANPSLTAAALSLRAARGMV